MHQAVWIAASNFALGALALRLIQLCSARRPLRAGALAPADSPAPLHDAPQKLPATDGDRPGADDATHDESPWGPSQNPELVRAAAAGMFVANRRLQSELAEARDELERQRQQVDSLVAEARTDALTGLPNRRSFDEELGRRFDQWRRNEVPVSLLLIDIDHFKSINDRFGHPTGDAALRWTARIVRAALREMDVPARYGGEEFAAILPGTRLAGASNVAERLRATIAARTFEENGARLAVTVSIGASTAMANDTPEELVARADEALYQAKRHGRNRAFARDRSGCARIEFDLSVVRHEYRAIQHIAPYDGAADIPPDALFRPVHCGDLSEKGISFVCDEAPECKTFVVRLGAPPKESHMIAAVANVTALRGEGAPRFRVGCSFVARLDGACEPQQAAGERATAC
ncbi:MAG TPA: GGDEF domain-containing protein [Pirellulales bacterium]|nr:GGDEF domain-containing protein [Pirellulales bacterium]